MSDGDDPLEGISEKSTKAAMLDRLNELADRLRKSERKRTGRLAEIEANVRSKYKPGDVPDLHNVIISATTEEWTDSVEFLGEFEDILPVSLARIREGGKLLLAGPDGEEDD